MLKHGNRYNYRGFQFFVGIVYTDKRYHIVRYYVIQNVA